ncbi:DUF1801 domain-containing protein [Brevundimonas sp. 2R-24]|uniref:DUF1801 domain-containing protein n=1 Tax=Peiella sedimenti TaxID=3061083 RepID=A0ABT8SLL5_9CAUL|nr:DUF1801 domain-containing protein [Caulobacteraceae bacterium XZ-24]
MAELKTRPTDASVEAFIDAVEHPGRREDARALDALLREVTGKAPQMWGPSIVGYGRYTYVNSTKKPADWPVIGFSPRKANMTLYIMPGFSERPDLMARIGKAKTSVSCLYFNRLSDLDPAALRELCAWSVATMRERYSTA